MPPSIKRLQVVLMTYLTRRAFHGMLLAMAAGAGIAWLMRAFHTSHAEIANVLLEALAMCLIPGSAIVAVVLFFLQAREQLMGVRARLLPESRTAHMIVIGVLFLGITVAVSSASWERPVAEPDSPTAHGRHGHWEPGVSPLGSSLVVLTFMTLAAYVAYNPWLAPILAAMLILAVGNSFVRALIQAMTITWPRWYTDRVIFVSFSWSLRAAVFLANVVALQLLVRMARPRPARDGEWRAIVRQLGSLIPIGPGRAFTAPALHRPITSLVSRGRHRRYATHSQRAPWALAAGLAVVLIMMLSVSVYSADPVPGSSKVCAALMMLTLVPGVVVASGWRERWPSLGYESLFPSGREQFVKEIAVGLASALAEFWFAALVICVGVLAFFTPRLLLTPPFIISVLVSAMMQALWFGAIFLTSRFRQVVPYVALLIGVGLGVLMPMFQFWQDNRLLSVGSFLLIALAEMICGIIFLIWGLGLWRRADLA